MRALGLAILMYASACTFEWNHQAPPFPLSGNPPSLSSFQKLNGDMPVGAAAIVTGADGAPWAEFCEYWDAGSGDSTRGCLKLHLSRISPAGQAPADEDWSGDQLWVAQQMIYIAHDDMTTMQRTLVMHRPGDPASRDITFMFPVGAARLAHSKDGIAFVYVLEDVSTTTFSLSRREPVFQRTLPLPGNAAAATSSIASVATFAFTSDDSRLLLEPVQGGCTVYSTLDDTTVNLETPGGTLAYDDDLEAFVTGSLGGLVLIPIDGSAHRPLPSGTDNSLGSAISIVDGFAYYINGDSGLWQQPLDGSAAPTLVGPGAARLWGRGSGGQVAYSHDPSTEYAAGSGDGWIGGRQVMLRGHMTSFSSDGTRFRYLEHAATLGGYGDLTTIGVAAGAAETLSLNCDDYQEVPDGRVLSIEDAVFTGTFNRLVIIDEAAQTKTWVTPSTADFVLTPDGSEIIADIVSGASGYDILRVPVPPR